MSNFAFSKKIALRYLWSRRSEAFITIITFISILGVAIGVMVLNMVMAVMTGFETELREKIVGANSHIVVRNLGGNISEWKQMGEEISKVPGVTSVSPFTYNQALIKYEGRTSGLLIRGIHKDSAGAAQISGYLKDDPEALSRLFKPAPVAIIDEEGKDAFAELPGILVGKELIRTLGLLPDTPVSILSPNVTSSPFGLLPKFKRFVVIGSYSSGLVEYESGLAYISLEEAQKFFKLGEAVTGLEVRVASIDEAPKLAKDILEKISNFAGLFVAQDWTEQNKPLWDALRLEKRVYFLVLLLIVVMASFSIISTLVMIVLEKRKDIAILKTLGATSSSISNIFKIQGAVIGGIGTIIGLILSYVGCKLLEAYGFPLDERIFPVSTVPVKILPLNFTIVGICAFFICFFATQYPARRASSIEPTETLRQSA